MADATSSKDVRDTLERQISDLRKEMEAISRSLGARASDAIDDAQDALGAAASRANGAAEAVGRRARAVTDALEEHPGTAAAVLSSAGVVGFMVGLVAGYLLAGGARR